MYKLDLEKGEEPEIKLPTSVGSQKNARELQKMSSLTMLKPLTVWLTTNCGKCLELGIPDHFTCLLKNLYAGKEATVRTRHGTMNQFKIGKEYVKAVYYYHFTYLTYMQSERK